MDYVQSFYGIVLDALTTLFLRSSLDLVPLRLPEMLLRRLWRAVLSCEFQNKLSTSLSEEDGNENINADRNVNGWKLFSTSMLKTWKGNFSHESFEAFIGLVLQINIFA